MRAFKTVNDGYIEPISFIVPRRAEVFQDDIYPPPVGSKAAMSAAEWFNGKIALPPKIDLASVYAGEVAKEVAPDYQPSSEKNPETASPSLISKPADKVADEPSMSAMKSPPPSMNQQTASIKSLAQKFNDTEEVDEDDASSFEEVPKPHEPPTPQDSLPVSSPNVGSSLSTGPGHLEDASSARKETPDVLNPLTQSVKAETNETAGLAQEKEQPESSGKPVLERLTPENDGVKQSLAEIKSLLEEQRKTMSAQNDTIGRLTAEVDRLRSTMNNSS